MSAVVHPVVIRAVRGRQIETHHHDAFEAGLPALVDYYTDHVGTVLTVHDAVTGERLHKGLAEPSDLGVQ